MMKKMMMIMKKKKKKKKKDSYLMTQRIRTGSWRSRETEKQNLRCYCCLRSGGKKLIPKIPLLLLQGFPLSPLIPLSYRRRRKKEEGRKKKEESRKEGRRKKEQGRRKKERRKKDCIDLEENDHVL